MATTPEGRVNQRLEDDTRASTMAEVIEDDNRSSEEGKAALISNSWELTTPG